MALQVTIAGVDRSSRVVLDTLTIQSILTSQPDNLSFTMRLPASALSEVPDATDEVTVTDDGAKVFGGKIIQNPYGFMVDRTGDIQVQITAQDYQIDTTRVLAAGDYASSASPKTAGQIVQQLITDYLSTYGITAGTIESGPTLDAYPINYQQVNDALQTLCKLVGFDWFIDYDKQLHFFSLQNPIPDAAWDLTEGTVAPYSTSAAIKSLSYQRDVTQLRNKVTVRGSSGASDLVTQTETSTGVETNWKLNFKNLVPGTLTMTIAGSGVLVGEKGKVDESTVDWLVDYENGAVVAATGTTAPANGAQVVFQYRYNFSLIVQALDEASIGLYGEWEAVVVNDSIKDRSIALQVAKAELRGYSSPATTVNYTTTRPGLAVGTRQRITLPRLGIDDVFRLKTITLKYHTYAQQALQHQAAGYFRTWAVQAERTVS